ncbi:uncharacterized protein LOC129586080 [Paramacrobiotus metropolitanus]|uniref:uncharacterized protein LOC129586080 n=1 Tax=Paramacrobiotus metropolitanus TaxID=2943436 RepID=UPI002445A1CE|nr:uncharacterized protein LOC129586080 [Paramacrobiotus metropolitanus]XP_055335057.1 uncharacterized protein LOC129586080 [Paramacrobiotus metropolitanus]
MFPLVYVLIGGKCMDLYRKVFQALYDSLAKLCEDGQDPSEPAYMLIDFEQAAWTAFRRIFRKTTVQGCLFHFGQNVYKRILKYGFSERYISDLQFNTQCKMLLALAFVPVDDVVKVYETFIQHPECVLEKDRKLIMYFERVYIGQTVKTRKGQGRRPPCFSIAFWNCHNRLLGGVQRTTNNAKGWHNGYATSSGSVIPDIYTFFGKLQLEQNLQEGRIGKLKKGEKPEPQRREFKELTERLMAVAVMYNDMDPLEYLENISRNVEMSWKDGEDESDSDGSEDWRCGKACCIGPVDFAL